MVGIRGYSSMASGGNYRVRMGAEPPWETAFKRDPEFREFVQRIRGSRNWGAKEYSEALEEFRFQRQLGSDRKAKEISDRRRREYAAAGLEYKPVSGVIRSVSSSGPSESSLKRKAERETKRAEIKSKQVEKADAKKLREIEQQGRDLLKKRNEMAQRPGYGEEVERLNEQLAELAFERDYLAGRSPTLKTAEERRREQAESASEIASREALTQQRLSGVQREKEAEKVRKEVSTWIAQNPDNPALARIKDLMSQSKLSGVDSLSIVLQAKALADAEQAKVTERARLQTERLQSMQDKQEDAQAFELESEQARAVERTGARSAAQQDKIVSFIQRLDAKIAGLETIIEEARSADPKLEPNVASRIPSAQRQLAGLQAERDAWQKLLNANYGSANINFNQEGSGQASSAARYSETNPARPETQADFDALPSGSYYINPADGMVYIKN